MSRAKGVKQFQDRVLALAVGMLVDETIREVCPACGGGSGKETSLALTRNEHGIVYCCHRASCGVRGFISTSGVLVAPKTLPKPNKQKEFRHETKELPNEWRNFLKRKHSFTEEEIGRAGIRYVPSIGRVYYPVFDIVGRTVGCTCRDYSGMDRTKSLAYPWNNDRTPFASFYHNEKGGRQVVLVEDCASAIRASSYLDAVALMGTQMDELLVGILSLNYDTVHIALDRDAIGQALKLKYKYDLAFKRCRMVLLPKDIKDMSRKELDKFMTSYILGR